MTGEMQAAFDRLADAWMKAVDDTFGALAKSPAYVQGMGKVMEAGFDARALWKQGLEKALAEARLASKDDVDRLAASLHAVEAKLNEVLLRLDEEKAARAREARKAPATGAVRKSKSA